MKIFLVILSIYIFFGNNFAFSQIKEKYNLGFQKVIIPSFLIGYGIYKISTNDLNSVDSSIKIYSESLNIKKNKIDDFTQYIPATMVYIFNAFDIKGEHNFKDRTIIYASSQIISTIFTYSLKNSTNIQRPDFSNYLSFPSGHTSAAFSSAHFLFKEYKNHNFWLSLSGYPLAIFTAMDRIINNKHWFSDVVTGAGFGILSTELTYFIFPKIKKYLFKDKNDISVVPFYSDNKVGISLVKYFK